MSKPSSSWDKGLTPQATPPERRYWRSEDTVMAIFFGGSVVVVAMVVLGAVAIRIFE